LSYHFDSIPLVVDLDGTLVKTDTLYESIIKLIKQSPFTILLFFSWLLQGKSFFKDEIAKRIAFNPETLPFNQELLIWLKEQKACNRRLILCTAANERVAQSIADHLGFFDAVLASDKQTNLSGLNKLKALRVTNGEGSFDYVGNSSADLAVWANARKAILVNASSSVMKRAQSHHNVEKVFLPTFVSLSQWGKVLRIHQWVKNFLLFVPLLAAHQMADLSSVQMLLLAFLSFNTLASSVYITNDLLDLDSDRQHPRKRFRPFSAGVIPILYGALLAPLLTAASLILACFIGTHFLAWMVIYFFTTISYSFRLKRIVLVDCLILAGLYTLRIIAGASAVNIPLSFWLLSFSIFFFLSLAFVKRYAELKMQANEGSQRIHGRGYSVSDGPLIQSLGVTSGYVSVLVLALYLNSDAVERLYAQPQIIWLAIPLMLFWISWVWMVAHRGKMHYDTILFAVRDRAILIISILFVLIFISASQMGRF